MIDNVEIKDIRYFAELARAGSLNRAAAITNTPKATLSLSLRRLEDALGVTLFLRTSKGLLLTDAGKSYLEHSTRIFDICDRATSAAQQAHSSVSGKIRIAASVEFGTSILGNATLYLTKEYPDLEFDVRVYSSNSLMTERLDFDCLIYVGSPPNSGYMCRKMGSVSYGIYAGPQYLAECDAIKDTSAIRDIPGVQYYRDGVPEPWIVSQGGKDHEVVFSNKFSVQDYWMAKYYAVSGVALAYLPDFFVNYETKSGALVPVLPHYRSGEITAYIIYPHSRHRNPRVKMVVDSICQSYETFINYPGYSLAPQSDMEVHQIGGKKHPAVNNQYVMKA